jgi:hypothetical protein
VLESSQKANENCFFFFIRSSSYNFHAGVHCMMLWHLQFFRKLSRRETSQFLPYSVISRSVESQKFNLFFVFVLLIL